MRIEEYDNGKKVNYRWKFRSDSDVNNEIPSFFKDIIYRRELRKFYFVGG